MLKLENTTLDSGEAANNWARACDMCRSAPCMVYCRQDSAFLCTACDARVHSVSSRHERVWVCESCERAPAAFLCKADAASLCAACDSNIHSANPLARRHQRVPIMPIPGMLYGPSMMVGQDDEDEAASWLLVNNNGGGLFGGGVDEYLDLDDYNSCQNRQFDDHHQFQNQRQDYNVPHKGKENYHQLEEEEDEYFQASNNEYTYHSSMSHSVSLSSMDVGVVPESTMSTEVSMTYQRPPKGTIDLFSGPTVQVPTQLSPMDREARVLRYREKKKTRKFEKTIRYASRKAYAETRPRIKGRFAKRTDQVDVEVDQMFSTSSLMAESAYGIVPSF